MKRRSFVFGSGALALEGYSIAGSSLSRKTPGGPLLGVYPYPPSTTPNQGISTIQSWLGRPLDWVVTYVSYESWSAFIGFSVPFMNGLPQFFSVPLTVTGTALSSVAAGEHDASFITVARTLAASAATGIVRVRFGWEFNANGNPWAANTPGAHNSAADYIAAYRRAVRVFRFVSSRFRFCWCSNSPQGDGAGGFVDPSHCYPGDAWVDVIGQDVYFNASSAAVDPLGMFNFFRDAAHFGMDWAAGFARARGKLLSIDEWGLNADAFSPLVTKMAEWMQASQVAYHSYWMSDLDFKGDLSGGRYPASAARFIEKFGRMR